MIISREELYLRWSFREFQTRETVEKEMPVSMLYREIKADAAHRNHSFLFDGTDLTKVLLAETGDSVGVNEFYQAGAVTEADRLAAVKRQVADGSYLPVRIFQSCDHPTAIYVDDGFHRIVAARQLELDYIRCKVMRGHYVLSRAIRLGDLPDLLDMLGGVLGKQHTIEEATELCKAENVKNVVLNYGKGRV